MAAKRTADAIPLCHPLAPHPRGRGRDAAPRRLRRSRRACAPTARTGAEMEALHAVAVAALTVYDMVKAADKGMTIGDIRLVRKTGGRSEVASGDASRRGVRSPQSAIGAGFPSRPRGRSRILLAFGEARTARALLCAALSAGCGGGGPLPRDLAGTLVFVSDRDGQDALYLRRLPGGADFQLTHLHEPVGEPALSPDGRQVAFTWAAASGSSPSTPTRSRSSRWAVDWQDASPCWRADGKALVVSLAPPGRVRRGPVPAGARPARRRGRPPAADAHRSPGRAPARLQPRRTSVAFVRGDNVYRLSLADGSVRGLTGGFRLVRTARFLPVGPAALPVEPGQAVRHGRDGRGRQEPRDAQPGQRVLPHGRRVARRAIPRGHADLRGERAALPAARGGAPPGREGAGDRDARGLVAHGHALADWGR